MTATREKRTSAGAQDGDAVAPPPLTGLRVLEFGHVVSGPYCAMMLADLGAEVIKVESPGRPDMLRTSGGAREDHHSLAFETVNRGKRSVTLDLSEPASRQRLDALLGTTDVLVQNFRPGVAERLGIGRERVWQINPKVIHVSISGFGETGPMRDLGGYDLIAQAMSGLMSVTGEAGGPPGKIGVPIADIACALYATVGVLAALRSRESTGLGQAIDCSLMDAGLSFGVWESAEYWATGQSPASSGNAHRALAPYQPVRSNDGWFIVAANTDEHFRRLTAALDLGAIAQDGRFTTNALRLANKEPLIEILENRTVSQPSAYWIDRLASHGVPCGELLDFAAALTHPQTLARDMVVQVGESGIDRPVLGNPLKMSRSPVRIGAAAPRIGQDNGLLDELSNGES